LRVPEQEPCRDGCTKDCTCFSSLRFGGERYGSPFGFAGLIMLRFLPKYNVSRPSSDILTNI
jgi:hypothetical protein